MRRSSRDSIVAGVAGAVITVLLAAGVNIFLQPFTVIQVGSRIVSNVTEAQILISNEGFSPANSIQITIQSNSGISSYQFASLDSSFQFERIDDNLVRGTTNRLVQDDVLILEVKLAKKLQSGDNLIVKVDHENGGGWASYILNERPTRTAGSDGMPPKISLLLLSMPLIGNVLILFAALNKNAFTPAIQLDIFLHTKLNKNYKHYFMVSLVEEVRLIKRAFDKDNMTMKYLAFYTWYLIPLSTRRELFPNAEYELVGELFTKLRMRDFDLQNDKLDSDKLRIINHECLQAANNVLERINHKKYPALRFGRRNWLR